MIGTNLKLILNNLFVPYSSYVFCYHQNFKQMESVTFWANILSIALHVHGQNP